MPSIAMFLNVLRIRETKGRQPEANQRGKLKHVDVHKVIRVKTTRASLGYCEIWAGITVSFPRLLNEFITFLSVHTYALLQILNVSRNELDDPKIFVMFSDGVSSFWPKILASVGVRFIGNDGAVLPNRIEFENYWCVSIEMNITCNLGVLHYRVDIWKLKQVKSRVEQLFMRFHISVKPSSMIGWNKTPETSIFKRKRGLCPSSTHLWSVWNNNSRTELLLLIYSLWFVHWSSFHFTLN